MSADLRFPVGKFERPASLPLGAAERALLIGDLERAPGELRALVAPLSDAQLDLAYRPGGWTIRQVVHHVPDSHMQGYVRMKLALTEAEPTIKVYREALWAELPEARTAAPEMSLALLETLHVRWVTFLRSLPPSEFEKVYVHPENGPMPLDVALALYAWHGKHHTGHVRQALQGHG